MKRRVNGGQLHAECGGQFGADSPKGDYNANDLINYCERHFGRIPKGPREPSLTELLPETLRSLPQRSNIDDHKSIFA